MDCYCKRLQTIRPIALGIGRTANGLCTTKCISFHFPQRQSTTWISDDVDIDCMYFRNAENQFSIFFFQFSKLLKCSTKNLLNPLVRTLDITGLKKLKIYKKIFLFLLWTTKILRKKYYCVNWNNIFYSCFLQLQIVRKLTKWILRSEKLKYVVLFFKVIIH